MAEILGEMKTEHTTQLEPAAMAARRDGACADGNLDAVSDAPAPAQGERDETSACSSPRRPASRCPRGSGSGRAANFEALLTFAEAAVVLGISLRQFRRLVDAGKVAFVKVSERTPRVRPSELQRFLDASAVKYSEVQS